jgi:peptidoglycan hydrolase-like protein with peptidoglycan-binding domain
MPTRDCDIVIQAGHENTPDGATGGSGPLGNEIDWTPIVANEAVAILQAAGVNTVKEDASIKHTDRTYRCKLAVFVHFDDPDSGESGPSVGYDHDDDEPAAKGWKELYKEFFPFNATWRPDNFTEDEHHYYGFAHTFTTDAEFLIEFGDLHSMRQAQWLKPRLRWLGSLLAHYLSRRSGLGNVPKPVPFDEVNHLGEPTIIRLKSKAFKGEPTLEAVASGQLVLLPSGNKVIGAGPVQDALKALAKHGHPEFDIDFEGNPNLRGFYGPKTTNAVKAFQKSRALADTGVVDQQTIEALDAATEELENTPEGSEERMIRPLGHVNGDDPLEPGPGAQPVGQGEPFSTKAASSGDENGSSKTTGLTGTTQAFSDGTVVSDATESLRAVRVDGLNGSLIGHWRRVQKGTTSAVRQENYSYSGRKLTDGALITDMEGIPSSVPAGFTATPIKTVKATQFGKGDRQDEGTGAPVMGTVQTNSDVVGASVKISVMAAVFGADWRRNAKRNDALIEVYFKKSRRLVRVPLVDVGPGENAPSHAEVDLTLACDQFLKTDGLAIVDYRLLVPKDLNS